MFLSCASRRLLLLAVLAVYPAGCSTGAPPDAQSVPDASVRFIDMSSRAGVEFIYRNGQEAGHYAVLESYGGGVGLLDFDGDDRLDLFLAGGGEFGPEQQIRGLRPALYQSEGGWQFADVTRQAGVERAPYYSHGVAAGDFDNDGFPDVLVTGYGGLVLYRNQGDGTFREMTEEAGLTDDLWSISAAWGDLDGDGSLDLYVAHNVDWSFDNHPVWMGPQRKRREIATPRMFRPLPDTLYISNGDGTFREASHVAGLRPDGKGLGVIIADVDLDGDCDIYVANDTTPNFLYRNQGRGRFREVGPRSGTSLSRAGVPDGSMGADLGDYNLDGLPDIFVTNYQDENFALYRNLGRFIFEHVSRAMGVTDVGQQHVGWGTVFFDSDRDGYEDIFATNGHVLRHPVGAAVKQPPLLFENRGGERFVNVAPSAGEYMARSHMGRGVAVGDLDNDGDLDLAVAHINEPTALLSNQTQNGHHWLSLRLIGIESSRDPVGATVRVRTGVGATVRVRTGEQVRQVKGGASYASTNDVRLFFGLGQWNGVDEVEIRWPSGVQQTLHDLPVDCTTVIHEPSPDRVTQLFNDNRSGSW